ncbi:MAG: hypothetical protein RMJ98_18790 [Myxococcales bacterium]|nr:hypothetical protein [Polyangiaceae bacterium]MDW8251348.1 hypothetical protein [Myxococcales bacterium]
MDVLSLDVLRRDRRLLYTNDIHGSLLETKESGQLLRQGSPEEDDFHDVCATDASLATPLDKHLARLLARSPHRHEPGCQQCILPLRPSRYLQEPPRSPPRLPP